MLILSRKIRESVLINKEITITVLRVEGNTVRLGFTAPEGVEILRTELVKPPLAR